LTHENLPNFLSLAVVTGDEVDLRAVNTGIVVERPHTGDQALSGVSDNEAGPLKGKIKPILIDVDGTPGVLAATAAELPHTVGNPSTMM
jgi:hypothetical protein